MIGDAGLAAVGVTFALSVSVHPALAALSLLPLVLIQRALALPALRQEAIRDHKTGLLNARGIERAARQELERAGRFDRPLSLIVCDLDNLRWINNTFGHLAGDAALAAAADTMYEQLRDYDICGRFGGDEFVIVLPETPERQAAEVAARIEHALASRLVTSGHHTFTATISSGVASASSPHPQFEALLADADAAMYHSKRQIGRQ
jgi:diguanylate cyclase (GGDEF)-like protein